MTALLSGTQAVRTSGALVLAGAVLSGPVAMLVVARMSPQPAWTGVNAFADHYHPVQLLLLIANGILGIIGAACTALFDRWVFSTAGLLSFAAWNLLVAVCFLLIAITRGGGVGGSPTEHPHGA